ncbi:DUF6318 family protein [Kribbella sp. NPDC051770]|uniref:DUF6318 family protein n=1 Tax=Kribbella sp. NPDC051770 TaxID=3155413 RepID=UPI00342A088B
MTLSACGSSSPPAGRPDIRPESASSTPTAGQTSVAVTTAPSGPSTAPERPAAAFGLSLAAGEAFIRHYIELLNYGARTGDVSAIQTASDPGCLGCAAYIKSVTKINAANGGLKGDFAERLIEVSELTRADDGQLAATTQLKVGAYTAQESSTAKPVSIAAAEYVQEMALAPSGGSWTVFEMELTKR